MGVFGWMDIDDVERGPCRDRECGGPWRGGLQLLVVLCPPPPPPLLPPGSVPLRFGSLGVGCTLGAFFPILPLLQNS